MAASKDGIRVWNRRTFALMECLYNNQSAFDGWIQARLLSVPGEERYVFLSEPAKGIFLFDTSTLKLVLQLTLDGVRRISILADDRMVITLSDATYVCPLPMAALNIIRPRRAPHVSPTLPYVAPTLPAASSTLPAVCPSESAAKGATPDAPQNRKHSRDSENEGGSKRAKHDRSDSDSDDVPDFQNMKEATTCSAHVMSLGTDSVAELVAAHLVGYRAEHLKYFKAAQSSIAVVLLRLGIFGGEFLVGSEGVISGEKFAEALLDQLTQDGRANEGTLIRLKNYYQLLSADCNATSDAEIAKL